MARDTGLNVVITGDTKGLERATRRSTSELDKLGKQTSVTARVTSKGFSGIGLAARGMAAGITAAVAGGGFLVKQFEDSNKIGKQTEAVLKSTGGAANVTAKQVGALATAISRKTGVDDEAVQSGENLLLTFTNIRNEAGRGNKIFTQTTRIVTDMSVALGQDMKSSAIQVGKALNDPIRGITALQRVGVTFTQSQRDQIKALVDSGHAMQAQRMILHELNREFGGSAAAQATPFDKLKVSAGNLAETLGGDLAPTLAKAANFLNRFLNQLQDGTGAGGKFVRWVKGAADTLKGAWQTAVAAVSRFIARNRDDIDSLGRAMRNIGIAIRAVVNDVILPTWRKLAPAIGDTLSGIITAMRGVIRIISGVLTGDWRKAWSGVKDIVAGLGKAIIAIIKGLGGALQTEMEAAGKAILHGIVAGLKGLGSAIKNAVVGAVKWAVKNIPQAIGDALKGLGHTITSGISKGFDKINPFSGGDGIGVAPVLGTPGLGGGMLMGADADLAPFASLAARDGLHTSSGLRPGAHTISGGLSYHATGDAIDEVGPFSSMRRYASELFHGFGGRLRELISPFPEFGIKDGRPFRYSAAIQAQHSGSNAHVHVAYTGPFGDGIGQIENLWTRQGGDRRKQAIAAAIAMAESSGRPGVTHRNADGSIDRGLWQINSTWGALSTTSRAGNARAAIQISHNGRDWSPWTTFRNGAYRRFLSAAQRVARSGRGAAAGKGGGSRFDVAPTFGGAVVGGGFGTGATAGVPSFGGVVNGPMFGAGAGVFTPTGDEPIPPSSLDYLDAAVAQAALTPGTADDLSAETARRDYWQDMFNRVNVPGADPRIVTAVATALKGEIDAVNSLKESIDGQTEVQKQLTAATQQLADEQTAIRKLAQTQGPQLVAGLAALLSGGIGGKVALGFQTPGFAGGGVRY